MNYIYYFQDSFGFQPDNECLENESSIGIVDCGNSVVDQQTYEIEIIEKEEIQEDHSALHTPTDIVIENESKSAALDDNFESSHEVFLDAIKCEPVSIAKG